LFEKKPRREKGGKFKDLALLFFYFCEMLEFIKEIFTTVYSLLDKGVHKSREKENFIE